MSEPQPNTKKRYVIVTGPTLRGFAGSWGTPGSWVYAAQTWRRLNDGTLVVLNGDVEVATYAPGQWANAHITRATTIEEAASRA